MCIVMNTKLSAIAKVLPGIVLVICAFLLAFWFSSSRRAGDMSKRVPGTDSQPAGQVASSPNSASPNTATAPITPNSPTLQQGTSAQPGAITGSPSTPAVSASIPALPGSWPRFRGADLDNVSIEKMPLSSSWKAGEPGIFWGLDVGEGHAGAAVVNSRVYLLDYDRAAQADVLRCLSFADGKELWRYSYGVIVKRNHGMSRTVPAVSGNYVVTLGPKCNVLCADAMTGKVHWAMDLVKQYGTTIPEWYAGQCPIIDNGRAIIAPGGKALMIAVDCTTGRVLWQTSNPDGWNMTHSSIVPMMFGGKRMYIYCASGGVVGVDAVNGAVLWKTSDWHVKIANVPTPVVIGGGRIFLTGGYNAGAMMLQISGGGGKFSVKTLYRLKPSVFGSDQQTPILYKGYIYGVIPGGQMVCLNLNGKQVWNSSGARFGLGPYLIADGKLFILNDTGVLTLAQASPSGYKQLAQAQILSGHDSWGPMAIAGGRLIARDLTRMVCVNVAKR